MKEQKSDLGKRLLEWRIVPLVTLIGALVTVPIVLLSIKCIDLPFSIWLHESQYDESLPWLRYLMNLPLIVAPLVPPYLLVYVWRRARSAAGFHEYVWFVTGVTFLAACEIKNMLKISFGRSWPRDVARGDYDLILSGIQSRGYVNDGIHLFKPFAGVKAFTAFPSGTTVIIVAALIPILAIYPRARLPLCILGLAMVVSLVQTNTHFISDVLAGAYVGIIIGTVGAVVIAQRSPESWQKSPSLLAN